MDDSMRRSRSQVMYKYLPEAYIDYYDKNTRTAYTARVKKWHSRRLENINNDRLLARVERAVKSFNDRESIKGYSMNFSSEEYDILEPVSTDKDPRVFAEIDPHIFYCEKCMKVYNIEHKYVANNTKGLKSKCCKASLKQIRLVYICKCGFAEGLKVRPCKKHGFEDIRYNNKFKYYCGICKKPIATFKKCDNCGTKLETKNPLDQSVLIPHSVAIIDLIDMQEEKLIKNISFSSEAIIAKYLNLITTEKFNRLYDYKEKSSIEIDNEKQKQREVLLQQGVPEEILEKIFATMRSDDDLSSDVSKMISKAIISESKFVRSGIGTNILEYWKIKGGSGEISLDEGIKVANQLQGNNMGELYRLAIKKAGICNIQLVTEVPIINSTYGYTRKESEPSEGVVLRAFPPEVQKKNIYALKIITEGIFLEIDKKRILDWLVINNFLKEDELPEVDGLEAWFLNNVECDAIPIFSDVNEEASFLTSKIYTLIHSISHALIKQASFFSGLDKNSLSEYIIPNTASVLIYCQNSQGYVLGALQNLFESCLDSWIESAIIEMQKCVFDPICSEKEHACFGCLYLNEISCRHFNKDLDRRFLVGYKSIESTEQIYGFWEEQLWQ